MGSISEAYSDSVPEGQVISQSPDAGSDVEPGSSVDLVVSLGEDDTDDMEPPSDDGDSGDGGSFGLWGLLGLAGLLATRRLRTSGRP